MRMADQGVMQARAKPLTYPCSVRDFLPEDPELCLVDLKDSMRAKTWKQVWRFDIYLVAC